MDSLLLPRRIQGRYQTVVAHRFFRRPLTVRNARSHISFTFDDFPQSAWRIGGAILEQFEVRATYYASLGLMGTDAPTGPIFTLEDLKSLLRHGHEVGCHTYSHCHSWETPSRVYEESILANRDALAQLVPSASFRSFSYPISGPRLLTKRKIGKHFSCCRGGGQTFNRHLLDLNYLKAFFLEKTQGDLRAVQQLIDQNRQAGGWLILVTHDIGDRPTPFGCTSTFFQSVVQYAVDSGAKVLPVGEALSSIQELS
jgi:peptidoglycan/xylan/chitin deacetylase (PgdA/CDA1 family)